MIARWFIRQDPLIRLFVLCMTGFAVMAFLALVVLPLIEAAGY